MCGSFIVLHVHVCFYVLCVVPLAVNTNCLLVKGQKRRLCHPIISYILNSVVNIMIKLYLLEVGCRCFKLHSPSRSLLSSSFEGEFDPHQEQNRRSSNKGDGHAQFPLVAPAVASSLSFGVLSQPHGRQPPLRHLQDKRDPVIVTSCSCKNLSLHQNYTGHEGIGNMRVGF